MCPTAAAGRLSDTTGQRGNFSPLKREGGLLWKTGRGGPVRDKQETNSLWVTIITTGGSWVVSKKFLGHATALAFPLWNRCWELALG